jgi:hypothetical protein
MLARVLYHRRVPDEEGRHCQTGSLRWPRERRRCPATAARWTRSTRSWEVPEVAPLLVPLTQLQRKLLLAAGMSRQTLCIGAVALGEIGARGT